MSYRKSLEDLKQQVFSTQEEEVAAPKKRLPGLIAARVEQTPLKDPITSPYVDWLRGIQQASESLRADSGESGGGFAEGFARAVDSGKREPVVVSVPERIPEERRDAFIQRRGSGPSYYAPRESTLGEDAGGFLGIMDKHEGGGDYDTLFQHSQREGGAFSGVKVSEMTLGELKAFAGDRGQNSYYSWSKTVMPKSTHAYKTGQGSTPMGRYQFVGSTLKEVANEMGLSDDTVFSPEVQDAMFEHYLKKRISMGNSLDEKVSHLRSAWEGFKNVDYNTLANLITKYGN